MTAHPTAPRRSADEQARFEAELRATYEGRIAFNQVLGLRIVSTDPDATRVRFDMRPELVGHRAYGQLHGGVTSAVLDAIGGLALMTAIAERFCDESTEKIMARFARIGTIDLRVDYLRRGIGASFEATARVSRLGGRIASVQMSLHADDGTLVATGAAAFTVG